jgi:hypothetical protein
MPCAGEDDYREAEQGSEIRPIPPPNPLQSFRQSLFSYRAVDVNHITGKDELIMITLLGQHICHPPAWLPPTVLAVPQGIDVQEIPIPTSNQTRMGFRGDWDQSCVKAPGAIGGFRPSRLSLQSEPWPRSVFYQQVRLIFLGRPADTDLQRDDLIAGRFAQTARGLIPKG